MIILPRKFLFFPGSSIIPVPAPDLVASGTGTSSAASSAYTPVADSWMIAVCSVGRSSNNCAQTTMTDSGGSGWTFIGGLNVQNGASTPAVRLDFHRKQASSSPVSMTATGASASASRMHINIFEVTGIAVDFSNVIFDDDVAGDPAPTLPSTQGPYGATLVAFSGWTNPAVTIPSPFTEAYNALNVNLRCVTGQKTAHTTPGMAWTTDCTVAVAGMLELKPA